MVTPELITYLKGEIAKGRTREDIRQTLVASGWTDLDVGDAFRQIMPMTSNTSINSTSSSSSGKKIFTTIIFLIIVGGLGFAGYFYRSNITDFLGSFSSPATPSQPTTPVPVVMNTPATPEVKNCGVTVKPDPKVPSSYTNNQALDCLGVSLANCNDAQATVSDDLFPTVFQVVKNNDSCNFKLSYPVDSVLTDVTGKPLAGQSITCPVGIVKTLDNTNPKAPVFKVATTDNLAKYATDTYFYGTLGVFMENSVDQNKIQAAGCSGDYISSVVASYQKMQTKK